MKKYLSFFRIRFSAGLQYRAQAWGGIATQFCWGGMSLLMFSAFYQSDPSSVPMEMSALSSYIWLQQSLLALYMAWYFDGDIFSSITSGNIAYELSRPIDIYTMWFIKNVASRTSGALLRFFPILAVAVFLPEPYSFSLPVSVTAFALFLLSSVLGVLVLVSFSMLIYLSAFYTISSNGIVRLSVSTVEFFSGGIIPIPFFPLAFQPIMYALPFASIQSTPFLIYVGQLSTADALMPICVQIFWFVALVAVGKAISRHALKRVVAQGG